MPDDKQTELEALHKIIQLLSEVDQDRRERLLHTVGTYFDINLASNAQLSTATHPAAPSTLERPSPGPGRPLSIPYSETEEDAPSPKDFLRQKQPQTDVERVACLAYYLTYFRDTPTFKTLEISKLNTEAAQPKFSNAAKACANALQYGYLASATKGKRQLSAAGEEFVAALPDRDLAKTALARARPKRRSTRRQKGRKESTKPDPGK